MNSIKTTVLVTLVLALVGCESAPLKIRSVGIQSGTDTVTNTATETGAIAPDASVPDAIPATDILAQPDTRSAIDTYGAKVDTQPSPDLAPAETNPFGCTDPIPTGIDFSPILVGYSDIIPSRIITANTNDNTVLSLDFDGASEPLLVQAMSVHVSGSNVGSVRSTINSVRLFDSSNTLFCSGSVVDGWLDCNDTAGLFTVNGKTKITAKVSVGQVYPSENNTAVSGDTFSLGLNIDTNINSRGHGYFLAVGTVTHKRYTTGGFAFASSCFIPMSIQIIGSPMVVYKSQPTVAAIALPSTVLVNGDNTLYKVSVTADTNGDIAIKQFVVTVSPNDIASIGNALLDINGSVYDNVAISNPGGTSGVINLKTGSISNPPVDLAMFVVFDPEMIVSAGTTKVFELRAEVVGAQAGSMIVSNIAYDQSDSTIGPIGSRTSNTLLWSDRSAAVHTTESSDWIGGYLVNALPTATATLSL